ncbi:Hypothetical predicted protein, partial [Olea europaea subsp. europaea]
NPLATVPFMMKVELGLVELNLLTGTLEEDRVTTAIENSNDNALPLAVIVEVINVLTDTKSLSHFAWQDRMDQN